MSRSVVGLDLDQFQVRAVQVRLDRRGEPAIERIARLDLPPGAIRGATVTDPGALGDALGSWWTSEGFSTRSVIIGLASPAVKVAVVEEPLMTSEELDEAMRGTGPSTLSVSPDDHLVDYQVIERATTATGEPMLRALLVGAPRRVVDPMLAALTRARLTPELVDLHAFALLRSLVHAPADNGATDVAGREGLVGVGGGGSVVVVHDGGSPRRIAVVGPELEPDGDPTAVRRPDPEWFDRTTDAVAAVVRGSNGDEVPSRVRVAGESGVVDELLPRLGADLGVTVEAADPFQGLTLPDGMSDVGDRPSLSVAVGLALAGREVAEGAHRLDLLPPAVSAPAVRRHALLAGAAVLATAVGLGALWLGRSAEADDTQDQADQLEAELVTLGVTVGDLSAVYDLAAEVEAQEAVIGDVLDGDVAWTKLLQEIATVQPDDVWLRRFTARGPTVGEAGFTVSGRGVDHTSAARWQIRLQGLPTVTDVWVPRSQRAADDALNRFGEVEFDSSGDLTDEALSDRVDYYVPLDPQVLGLEPVPGAAATGVDDGDGSDTGGPS